MNNEIKEILDRIETASEIFDCLLKPEECTELIDYITNLQQENNELKSKLECYENGVYYSEEVDNLQQENERLKENNQNMQEEMARVWEENEELKKKLDRRYYKNEYERLKEELENKCWDEASVRADILLEQDDYKSRCEKAIEYMKSIELEPDADMYMQIGEYNEYKYLLNILQNGSDKNDK